MFLINEIEFIPFQQNKYIILNLINAACDIISDDIYNSLIQKKINILNQDIIKQLLARKYLFYTKNEYDFFIQELNDTINKKELESAPNFLIVPTYACNLSCIYCYEQKYKITSQKLRPQLEMAEIQFNRIKEILLNHPNISPSSVRITLMGGEPLLKGNIETIRYILEQAHIMTYSVNAITNGVDLDYFIDDLLKYNVNHVQITIDGIKEFHDRRRVDKKGNGSFDKIIQNIKIALKKGLSIDLRVNVDKTNLSNLPELANYVVENFSDYTNLYPYFYLLQDGGCSGNSDILDEEETIYSILELEKQHPNMKIFNKQYHGFEFINAIKNNQEYSPVLRHCAASKNQYILDIRGDIYKCWHGIGNTKHTIGKYDKNWELEKEKEDIWKNRSSIYFDKCSKCKYRYLCGTGCPAAEPDKEGSFDPKTYRCVDFKKILNALILTNLNLE